MIKHILIVEDEPALQRSLERLIEKNFSFESIKIANSVESAKVLLANAPIDLIFLDMNLPDGNGLEVIEPSKVDGDEPLVIITTAYEEFAIEAIKSNVVDYLLKPIDPDEFVSAVDNAIEKARSNDESVQTSPTGNRLAVFTSERISLIEPKNIVRAQSSNNYTTLYLADGAKHLISRTLKDVERTLAPLGFMRVHQSHLVNLDHIVSFEKQGIGMLSMTDSSEVQVSNTYRGQLIDLLRKSSF